jgi:Mg2+/Co2+ transporter CorB
LPLIMVLIVVIYFSARESGLMNASGTWIRIRDISDISSV